MAVDAARPNRGTRWVRDPFGLLRKRRERTAGAVFDKLRTIVGHGATLGNTAPPIVIEFGLVLVVGVATAAISVVATIGASARRAAGRRGAVAATFAIITARRRAIPLGAASGSGRTGARTGGR